MGRWRQPLRLSLVSIAILQQAPPAVENSRNIAPHAASKAGALGQTTGAGAGGQGMRSASGGSQ
jgi:hypothetical protein